MASKIYIFGDSHTRAFAFRKDIVPLFVDKGNKFNLRMNPNKMVARILEVYSKCELSDSDEVYLYFGEPDCRLQLGHGSEPDRNLDGVLPNKHRLHYVVRESKVDTDYLDTSIKNYLEAIRLIDKKIPQSVKLITPTTGYPPVFEAMRYFIETLRMSLPSNIVMVDTFNNVFNSSGDVYPEYLDTRMRSEGDPIDRVHLNSKISEVFISELQSMGFCKAGDYIYTKDSIVTSDSLKSRFKKNERFGTYTLI